MKMKKLMTVAAVAALLVSCGGGQQGKPDFGDNEYAVRTIGASDANLETTYPATFKGMQDVEIRPKVSGFITRVYVKEGQQVGAGQVLFQIDNVTYRAAVNHTRMHRNCMRRTSSVIMSCSQARTSMRVHRLRLVRPRLD